MRTRLNVRDSDATLIVRAAHTHSPGSDLTAAAAVELERPYLVTAGDPVVTASWLSALTAPGRPIALNVAGPRESNQPGIYEVARALLLAVLGATR